MGLSWDDEYDALEERAARYSLRGIFALCTALSASVAVVLALLLLG